jgi:hypothetical protein
MNLNKLIDFAKKQAISISINYWEASDTYEIETISAAPSENFYMKRCYDVDYFIESWWDHVKSQLKSPASSE